jgi:hypothetical protein
VPEGLDEPERVPALVRDAVIRDVIERVARVDADNLELNDIVPDEDREGDALEDGEDVDDADNDTVREARIDGEKRLDTELDNEALVLGEGVAEDDKDADAE